MEEWIPMFEIFLKSPSPETEASLWLDEASNSSSSSASMASPINRSSFLSLLKKPCDVTDQNSSPATKKVLFIETLPNMAQSRILSFLLFEYRRFCVRDLVWLAREMLGGGKELDFWVQRAAHNLLDRIPEPTFDWISHLDLDSADDSRIGDEYDSVPDWLSEKAGSNGTILPWLPVSLDDVNSEMLVVDSWNGKEMMSQVRENMENDHREVVDNIDHTINVALHPNDHEMAAKIRAQITSFESTSEFVTLCDEIRKLCLEKGRDSFRFLALIEPWNADDETASVFLSNLHNGSEDEQFGWPSQILCSIVLPKFLALEKSASRVLMSAIIEFCKIHQRAAEYALVFPLILRKEGINGFICENRREENILIHDVPLSQGSVDCLVSKVQELAERTEQDVVFKGLVRRYESEIKAYLSQDEPYSNISSFVGMTWWQRMNCDLISEQDSLNSKVADLTSALAEAEEVKKKEVSRVEDEVAELKSSSKDVVARAINEAKKKARSKSRKSLEIMEERSRSQTEVDRLASVVSQVVGAIRRIEKAAKDAVPVDVAKKEKVEAHLAGYNVEAEKIVLPSFPEDSSDDETVKTANEEAANDKAEDEADQVKSLRR
ncbi:hypothetical protein AALP_AA7G143900 [Arabis alpina]|uniref:Fanconi Anaemia group E protein C-terminal domain-containing protein n=1 Tax=Arabis alpina TaxID=50452 RepID=A0A087GI10_ARAAL|nr:hypothetical protein AALP_AA7G143900 [Arabis alpina]